MPTLPDDSYPSQDANVYSIARASVSALDCCHRGPNFEHLKKCWRYCFEQLGELDYGGSISQRVPADERPRTADVLLNR